MPSSGEVIAGGLLGAGLGLYLTETSAGVLGEFLGVEPALLDGAPFGIATSTLVPIPEPGTALLLGAGFLGVALRRRIRSLPGKRTG